MRTTHQKICWLLISGFFLGLSLTVRADLTISQLIEDFQTTPTVPPEQLKIFLSGNRIRIDQGQKISSIILKDKKVTYSILHETKEYVVLPHEADSGAAPASPQAAATSPATATTTAGSSTPDDDYVVESTGKTEQIHGYTCKEVKIKEKDGSVSDLMISSQALDVNTFYKEFLGFMEFGMTGVNKQLEKHPELKGIPVRVTEYSKDQRKLRQSTINRIEASKIDETIFQVPAGYSQIKLGE